MASARQQRKVSSGATCAAGAAGTPGDAAANPEGSGDSGGAEEGEGAVVAAATKSEWNEADWPSNQFLFRMDPEHEAVITIMQGYIRSNFHACVVYSKQFEPYCRLVTAAKVTISSLVTPNV